MSRHLLARIFFIAVLMLSSFAAAGPRDEQWKAVDEAIKKGLPKTAVEALGPIIQGALKDKAYAEAIKAIAKRIAYEGNIQGNKPEEKIALLKKEIASAPAEMKPVLEAILANWYWHYFQQNRWRFVQRTQTAAPPSDDLQTWDLPRILAVIDAQFQQALAQPAVLQKIAIAEYNDLLEKGNSPDSYRPTLYDFVAHNALAFYSSGEQAGSKAEDHFELAAESPALSTAEEFATWELKTTDEQSLTVRALRLYQALLKFHAKDDDRSAYLDTDLWRLQFAYNKAFGEEKKARYVAALKKFVEQHENHELSTRAAAAWAGVLQSDNELLEAHKIATIGKNRFPESIGGRQCHNIIVQIEAQSSQLLTERVWNDPWPVLQVRYRNVKKMWYRVVADDWEARITKGHSRPEWLDQNDRQQLLAKPAVHSGSFELPATDDYLERAEEIPLPKDLKPGFYFLIASHDEQFSAANNVVLFTDFWVSDLALVMRNRQGDAVLEGFVLQAKSGEPVVEAEVKSWIAQNNGTRKPGPVTTTDQNGFFRLAGMHQKNVSLLVKTKEQQLASQNDYWAFQHDSSTKPYHRTIFFTDRSLYRPGQTIQFKGICIRVNTDADDYAVLPNKELSVVFNDPNGKEIAKQVVKTNDFGSFSGSFTAPRDRLMGRMHLHAQGDAPGAANVSVEEYKRPKFQVTLEAPKSAAKLNGTVNLSGKALAYTGAAIDGAKVKWRVVRQVRYPDWWGWYYWWRMPVGNNQEIAHGTAQTDSLGNFALEFLAKPDVAVLEKDEPTFSYSISADVTDTTGETRSAQRVINVGYTALKASLSAQEWLTVGQPVEVNIATTTLDGEAQAAEGKIKIYQLQQPKTVVRPRIMHQPQPRFAGKGANAIEPPADPANPNSWPLGALVSEQGFSSDATGQAKLSTPLAAGIYRVVLETQDRFGKPVVARLPLRVFDPQANKLAIKVPEVLVAEHWSTEPGKKFKALWGTGYDTGRAFVEIEHRRKIVQAYWTDAAKTQALIEQEITEAHRGGFTLRVTMVRENRAYLETRRIDVPWTNKQLTLKWEHFTSKLEPAQKESWTAIITGPKAEKAVAEVAATLYDASLDAYQPHHWLSSFNVFRQDHVNVWSQFENQAKQLHHLQGQWPNRMKDTSLTYRQLPAEITANLWAFAFYGNGKGGGMMPRAAMAPMTAERESLRGMNQLEQAAASDKQADASEKQFAKSEASNRRKDAGRDEAGGAPPPAPPGPDLGSVSPRKNLNETAFFFPQITSTKEGEVRLEFTMPEALTEWKFLGFAHDKELRSGVLQDKTITAKDLMVQPNPPRFVREGDVLEFTVKVSNQSATRQTGKVRLTFADARTLASVDAQLGNSLTDLAFDIPAKESQSLAWKLKVPDGLGFLTYKAIGSSGRISDGEEGFLPVLSRRILVTESLPLPIRGKQSKQIDFTKLVESGKSDSLQNKSLTVQMVSNPSWYAVMALPYLMESPHPCSEQVFNRLYANSLARHIANSDPKIRRVFELWKNPVLVSPSGEKLPDPLDSPLFKNQDLKAVMIEETPWFRQAVNESQARRNVGILFEDNRLNDEAARLGKQLAEMQQADGTWPWFPGGPGNEYITLYITTGYGRLRHLGVKPDMAPAIKSLDRLDAWADRIYRDILKHGKKEDNHLSCLIAQYLYGRSFFLSDKPIAAQNKEAVDYFLSQAKEHWLKLGVRQSQAQLAIALKRFGQQPTAAGIMASLKERSVTNEELGRFWRDLEISFSWFHAPIETQALMIEAFDEVTNDTTAVEDCKVWLLKQKQTQDWKTTKATADAVYALLLRGSNVLASDALVDLSLGGQPVKPDTVEAGTGFFEKRFVGPEIKPELGKVSLQKKDEGVAWGSLHWQYLEDVAKVTPHSATPLKLKKQLFVKEHSKQGPVLKPVVGAVNVGDELVTRIELRTDRDLEYVHLKDHRGSGTEPVNVLSRYKYQDGLGYYESTRDTASHFFIDYLPKGVYVFEYSVRIQHRGQYQTGLANIECMYAPEFNSHSESLKLEVK